MFVKCGLVCNGMLPMNIIPSKNTNDNQLLWTLLSQNLGLVASTYLKTRFYILHHLVHRYSLHCDGRPVGSWHGQLGVEDG